MKYALIFLLLTSSFGFSQQSDVKEAFLEKWQNSRDYLIAIAEAMPEEDYAFKPTERQMSFAEQLIHIQSNIDWLGTTYFKMEEAEISTVENEKKRIIQNLKNSFNKLYQAVEKTAISDLKETVDFFAGSKSKLQILNLLQDHVTHHRGQLLVYLNLKNVEPPKYVGW